MCGITGYFSVKKSFERDVLDKMCDALHYRGPDDSGTYFFSAENVEVAMGHRRLSIIDLSTGGHQPKHYNQWHITFNGEIYNYKEIAKELILEGYHFETTSDTEVILKAFDKWGVEAVSKFIGMFSFVLLNESTRKLYCFRDRAGVKPFYYYSLGNDFIWASELKAIHEHPSFEKILDFASLKLYLQYGYIPAPNSIFKNVRKLRPGHYLEIDLNENSLSEKKYWDVYDYYAAPKLSNNENEVLEQLEKLLVSACNYRMVADVPVGVFLSGGFDSTVVAALLQQNREEKIKTFTIGFADLGFDEAPFAKQIAAHLGTEHHEYYCTEKEAKEVVPLLPYMYDEPFGDSSAIPTYFVSKMAREHVTVALSADGGDETFFGYNKYPNLIERYNQIKALPKIKRELIRLGMPLANFVYSKNTHKLRRLSVLERGLNRDDLNMLDFNSWSTQRFHPGNLGLLLLNESNEINETYFTEKDANTNKMDLFDQLLAVDYKTYLVDDILTKVDRATMAVSLEGREPLLDHRLIEFAATIPMSLKFKDQSQKYLLKQIAYKYVPAHLLDRPKTGFAIPLHNWFRNDMKYLLDEHFEASFLKSQGIFNSNYVLGLLREYYSGRDSVFEQIWFLLMFQMWYKKWML